MKNLIAYNYKEAKNLLKENKGKIKSLILIDPSPTFFRKLIPKRVVNFVVFRRRGDKTFKFSVDPNFTTSRVIEVKTDDNIKDCEQVKLFLERII